MNPEKIAVVLPNHLGDVAMATPALRALRAGRPEARIVASVRASLAGLLGGSPAVDDLVPHRIYESRGRLAKTRERLAHARGLRPVDTAVVLPNSWSGAILARATGARERVGYARHGRSFLLTRPIEPPREQGRFRPIAMERYYLDLVRALGCPDRGTALELALEPHAEAECEALLEERGIDPSSRLVCLAPGAGYGPAKLWPLPYVAETARTLLREGDEVALVHGPGEEPLADEIARRAGPGLHVLGGARMTLSLLKSLIARAKLLICNDAGARHVAAAFGTPALVLFGPTSLDYTNLNLGKTRILREPVDCAPCQRRVCPIDHRCMTRLRPERVIEEARAALRDPAWRGSVELEYGA